MAAYKQDQGRMARMATFWSLTVLIFYGCTSLRAELVGRFDVMARPLSDAMPKVPVLGMQLNPALLIVAVLFVAGVWTVRRWIETPKNADLLIDTEAELRKVTWPTPKEVANSSVVVIISVIFLMAFLAGADVVLARIASLVLGG